MSQYLNVDEVLNVAPSEMIDLTTLVLFLKNVLCIGISAYAKSYCLGQEPHYDHYQ